MKARIPYKMTSSQRKAMKEEIKHQIVENEKKFSIEYDAMVLWSAYVCGFGKKKKLKKLWDVLIKEHKRLREHYQLAPEDDGWLYLHLLKEHLGIDLEEWYQEEKEGDTNAR